MSSVTDDRMEELGLLGYTGSLADREREYAVDRLTLTNLPVDPDATDIAQWNTSASITEEVDSSWFNSGSSSIKFTDTDTVSGTIYARYSSTFYSLLPGEYASVRYIVRAVTSVSVGLRGFEYDAASGTLASDFLINFINLEAGKVFIFEHLNFTPSNPNTVKWLPVLTVASGEVGKSVQVDSVAVYHHGNTPVDWLHVPYAPDIANLSISDLQRHLPSEV